MKQVVQSMEKKHNASKESETKSLITSRSINFPQIRDNVGNVISWSWREIRKWEVCMWFLQAIASVIIGGMIFITGMTVGYTKHEHETRKRL